MTLEKDLLLDVRDVSVDYYAASGTVHAVDNVSFTLKRGEIIGIAGESGSGKSTLAYAIARLLRPPAAITNGEVIYWPHPGGRERGNVRLTELKNRSQDIHDPAAGEPVNIFAFSPSQLRAFRWNELSIVFQSAMNALNPVMKIGTQIMDVLETHCPDMGTRERNARAVELLQMVGIAEDRLNSYPHELSGGMRQRAVIAIALALEPELIIMDEPTTALDVVVQREILELISDLCKSLNTAMIFITHDLSLLLELADKLIIMYAGKLIETASNIDIFEHPRHPYSYGLLNSFPKIQGPRRRMSGIPGSPPDLRNVPSGCPFHPRCPLVFDACSTEEPVLLPVLISASDQLVACHLYNARYRSEPPATSQLAESYEALAERGTVR